MINRTVITDTNGKPNYGSLVHKYLNLCSLFILHTANLLIGQTKKWLNYKTSVEQRMSVFFALLFRPSDGVFSYTV